MINTGWPRHVPSFYAFKVCQPGSAQCCRYLVAGPEGFECAKHCVSLREIINQRVAEGTFRAIGDNCPGYGVEPVPEGTSIH